LKVLFLNLKVLDYRKHIAEQREIVQLNLELANDNRLAAFHNLKEDSIVADERAIIATKRKRDDLENLKQEEIKANQRKHHY